MTILCTESKPLQNLAPCVCRVQHYPNLDDFGNFTKVEKITSYLTCFLNLPNLASYSCKTCNQPIMAQQTGHRPGGAPPTPFSAHRLSTATAGNTAAFTPSRQSSRRLSTPYLPYAALLFSILPLSLLLPPTSPSLPFFVFIIFIRYYIKSRAFLRENRATAVASV